MADQIKFRGGTEAEHSAFVGAEREVTVDTTLHTLRVHDGVTPGGWPIGGDVSTSEDKVALVNQGPFTGDCNVPSSFGLSSQMDLNGWITDAIQILDTELCALKAIVDGLDDRIDENEKDIAVLKESIKNIEENINDLQQLVADLELEVEKNQDNITDNSIAIGKLEVEVNNIKQEIEDLKQDIGKIEVNDGVLTINNSDGTLAGQFTANQKTPTTVVLPQGFTGSWNDLTDKPTEFPPAPHDHTLAELTDTAVGGQTDGQALIWDDSQKLWINSDIPESGISQGDLDAALLAQKLDDHVDVTVPNPKDKDYLSWDDRLQLWVATSPFALPPAVQFKGVLNLAGPAPMNPKPGDAWIHHDPNITRQDDTVIADGSWSGIGGETIHEGEYVIYSTDDEWHHTGGGSVELSELQSDWNQVDPLEPDYIHNKPDIPAIIDAEAGDGQINVNAGDGLAAAGNNATANQKGDTTRTLSVKTGDGLAIDVNGNVIIDPNFNLDGNISEPGNGAIKVEAGAGLSATGQNATANQAGDTTRTLSVKTGNGLEIDANGNIIIDPNYNLDGNVTKPNDGKLTIKDSDGATVGEFTADQAGNTDVTLPKGFSGDYGDLNNVPTEFPPSTHTHSYNDLTDKPDINNGKLTIKDSGGNAVGEFTANQAGNTDVSLPKGFSGSWNDLTDKPSKFPPEAHEHPYMPLDIRTLQELS